MLPFLRDLYLVAYEKVYIHAYILKKCIYMHTYSWIWHLVCAVHPMPCRAILQWYRPQGSKWPMQGSYLFVFIHKMFAADVLHCSNVLWTCMYGFVYMYDKHALSTTNYLFVLIHKDDCCWCVAAPIRPKSEAAVAMCWTRMIAADVLHYCNQFEAQSKGICMHIRWMYSGPQIHYPVTVCFMNIVRVVSWISCVWFHEYHACGFMNIMRVCCRGDTIAAKAAQTRKAPHVTHAQSSAIPLTASAQSCALICPPVAAAARRDGTVL